ncbi:hypothetical protein [Flavobacterium sp.]|uniref:hypothetical protein n=1 Tax=Flavobacterium sp. TaxID=239 RepID=UPI002B4B1FA6|nr:hypothetical protein [Flavobacterium sp.]HLF52331.1 hypothetical protein [Flavobacterium sp.]
MATKKKRRTRKRSMSESGLSRRVSGTRTTARRRRTRSRSKGMLSEMFSPATAQQTGKAMLSGAIAGYGVASIEPMLQGLPKWAKHATLLGGSFLTGTVLKMPNMSVGIASAWGYSFAKDMQAMGEDGDWADEDAMDEEPEYLDEAGNPMFLAADGNFYYLDEDDEMSEDDEFMDEDDEDEMSEEFLADDSIYPAYVNTSRY